MNWSIGSLLGATPLEKKDSPSPSTDELPMAPQQGEELHVSLCHTCWNFDWLDLVQGWYKHLQCPELMSATALPNPGDNDSSSPPQPYLHPATSSMAFSGSWEVGAGVEWYSDRLGLEDSTVTYSLLFGQLRVVILSVTHCKEQASLMRSKSCNDLWI